MGEKKSEGIQIGDGGVRGDAMEGLNMGEGWGWEWDRERMVGLE